MGEFYSILCSFTWAIAVILFKKTGDKISPIALNLFKNAVASVLFILTLIIFSETFSGFNSGLDIILLCVSGIMGVSFADTLFFMSLNRLGPSLFAIVDCLYSPIAILLTSLFFAEQIGFGVILGACLIGFAILVASVKVSHNHISRKDLIIGIITGILSVLMIAISIIMIKKPMFVDYSILEKYSPLWSTSIRLISASIFLIFIGLAHKDRRVIFRTFIPANIWKYMIPASIMGAYISLIVWIMGMKYIDKVNVAIILNQLTIVFIVLLAWMFYKESMTVRKVISIVLAISGGIAVLI